MQPKIVRVDGTIIGRSFQIRASRQHNSGCIAGIAYHHAGIAGHTYSPCRPLASTPYRETAKLYRRPAPGLAARHAPRELRWAARAPPPRYRCSVTCMTMAVSPHVCISRCNDNPCVFAAPAYRPAADRACTVRDMPPMPCPPPYRNSGRDNRRRPATAPPKTQRQMPRRLEVIFSCCFRLPEKEGYFAARVKTFLRALKIINAAANIGRLPGSGAGLPGSQIRRCP